MAMFQMDMGHMLCIIDEVHGIAASYLSELGIDAELQQHLRNCMDVHIRIREM